MKAYPANVAQGTTSTQVNTTNWNNIVDALTDIKEYQAKGVVFDVAAYGATGAGIVDDSDAFDDAIVDATVSGGVVLVPPGTFKLSDNVTIPADVLVWFAYGAQISVDNTKTFAFSARSGLKAEISHIFAGSGDVTFGKGVCPCVYPQWWGALGDDSTDCATAFNKALGAAATIGTVYIPTGTYRITTPINEWPVTANWNLQDAGIVFRGAGQGDTVINYTGVTGYALEITPASQFTTSVVAGHTVTDLHIKANSVTDEDTGGAILANGSNHTIERVTVTYCNDGTAFAFISRDVSTPETGMTHDTDRDFTTTGAGASEKYAFKFTTPAVVRLLHSVTVTLGITGAPAGTIHAEIWTDVAGAPGAQIYSDSETVTLTDLSAAAGGAEQKLLFGETNSPPTLTASTDYWVVLSTTGYTYTDGVTEVRLRVDAAGGAAASFGTYDFGVAWGTSNDGLNNNVEIRYGQGIGHKLNDCFTYGGSDRVERAVRLEDGAIVNLYGNHFACEQGFYIKRSSLLCSGTYIFASMQVIEAHGAGWINFGPGSWLEGGATNNEITGKISLQMAASITGGGYWDIGDEVMMMVAGQERNPTIATYQPAVRNDYWYHRVIHSKNGKWNTSGTVIDPVTDADALMGEAFKLDAQSEARQLSIFPDDAGAGQHHYSQLPAGTYQLEVWARDTNQVANDFRVQIQGYQGSWNSETLTKYTLTADYRPYYAYFVVDEAMFVSSLHGSRAYMYKTYATANEIYISHIVVRYLGTDRVMRNELVCYNSLAGDADGDRESRVLFAGRASGEEVTTLAAITASHDGAADDKKGKLIIGTGAAASGPGVWEPPTAALTIDSSQNAILAGDFVSDTYNFAVDAEASDTYVITLDPAPAAYVTGMMIIFTANTANTGACTVNVNGLGAKSLKMLHDQDPGNNYIESGSVVMAVYDGSAFQMIQGAAN